jgi:hypothetical protein
MGRGPAPSPDSLPTSPHPRPPVDRSRSVPYGIDNLHLGADIASICHAQTPQTHLSTALLDQREPIDRVGRRLQDHTRRSAPAVLAQRQDFARQPSRIAVVGHLRPPEIYEVRQRWVGLIRGRTGPR